MTFPSTASTEPHKPQVDQATSPANSRYTTPIGSRPGSPTPYSRGQHLLHAQEHPCSNHDSVEKDDESAISDTALEQNETDFARSRSLKRRVAVTIDEEMVAAFKKEVKREEEEEHTAKANDSGDENKNN